MTTQGVNALAAAAREFDDLVQRVAALESQVNSLLARREVLTRTAYKPSEVAAMLGENPATIREWIKDGRLSAVDMGGWYAVRAESVANLLDASPRHQHSRGKWSRAKGEVQADVPRNAWSVREFAAALGVNKHTIYRACNRGEIAWVQVGGEKRIPNAELERMVAEAYKQASAARST